MDGNIWEDAYARFETNRESVRKFKRRLKSFGVEVWPRDTRIIEVFCGSGNGLLALEEFGFNNLSGCDLSHRLLSRYSGKGKVFVADARRLPIADDSFDVVVVQGGLHHLEHLPSDLVDVVSEVDRVLCPQGRFVIVEPWATPFLRVVHAAIEFKSVRRLSRKCDALHVMIENEKQTYLNWLSHPAAVLAVLNDKFEPVMLRREYGKLFYLGVKRVH